MLKKLYVALTLLTLTLPTYAMQFREDICTGKDNLEWTFDKRILKSKEKVQENPLFGSSVAILSNDVYYNGVMLDEYHGITCGHFGDKTNMIVTDTDFFCPLLKLKKSENFITVYEPHPNYIKRENEKGLILAQLIIDKLECPDSAISDSKGLNDIALFKVKNPIIKKKYPEIYYEKKDYKKAFQKTNCYAVGVTTLYDTTFGLKIPMSTKLAGITNLTYSEKNHLFYSQLKSPAGDKKAHFQVDPEMHQFQIRFQDGLSGAPIFCKPKGQDWKICAIATNAAVFPKPELLYQRGKELNKPVPYYPTYDISTPLGDYKEWITDFMKK